MPVSESDQPDVRRTVTIDDDERAWLDARLVEYHELLAYLRDH